MEIKQLHKGHLQNMEHLNFAEHVLIMNKEANIDKIKPLLPPLEKAIKDEEEALNQPTKLEGTRELIALDEERDRAYRARRGTRPRISRHAIHAQFEAARRR